MWRTALQRTELAVEGVETAGNEVNEVVIFEADLRGLQARAIVK